ncbi:MAG TPA: hypothetical protein VFM55_03720 [Micromonosporaceae bacterium]|nr:hypothetical protein [Micromonosporaceae bacterium]
MAGLAERVAAEIRLLRKGRGINAPDIEARLGPHLRELVAGATGPDDGDCRRSLATEINSCTAGLPEDLRTAITASLGLSAETRQIPKLRDRITWLSAQLGRGYRTALRRVDVAERLLAEEIAHELRRRRGQAAGTPQGWYLDELRTVLRLDTPTPEAHEHRRIVATCDDLREVMAWLDVPRDPGCSGPALNADVLYGGRLIRREQPLRGRFQFMIQLPAPLRTGESHEYGMILRIAEGEPMQPHYVFTPECQCNLFSLRVRFPPDRTPHWVWRVAGETVRMFEAARPGRDLLALDEAGEVQVRFPNPTMYLGYGIQWAW